jgi:hypothetical protein
MNGRLILVMQALPDAKYPANKQSQDENPWVGMPKPKKASSQECQRQNPDGHQCRKEPKEVQKRQHRSKVKSAAYLTDS